MQAHPDGRIFLSLFKSPASVITAAELLAEIGDCRERYPTRDALAANAGHAAVAKESGKRKTASFRWGCNKRLRIAFCRLANSSRHCHPWAQDLYARARQRGHEHPRAIRTVGRAWCRIVWQLWRNHTTYEPAPRRGLHPAGRGPRSSEIAKRTRKLSGVRIGVCAGSRVAAASVANALLFARRAHAHANVSISPGIDSQSRTDVGSIARLPVGLRHRRHLWRRFAFAVCAAASAGVVVPFALAAHPHGHANYIDQDYAHDHKFALTLEMKTGTKMVFFLCYVNRPGADQGDHLNNVAPIIVKSTGAFSFNGVARWALKGTTARVKLAGRFISPRTATGVFTAPCAANHHFTALFAPSTG